MLELVTAPGNLPFSVALGLVFALALIQVIGLGDMLGGDADLDLDADIHADHGGFGLDSGLLSLIGLGRVPFMVWLTVLLSAFGILGFSAQELLAALTGASWSAWLVGPAAGLAALPLTGAISRPLGHLLPKDETTAVDRAALVGREGEIVIGTARQGSPARARVMDHFGQVHHVMLEPDNAGQTFVTGERVLIVRREGELFKAIARGDHYLPRLG
ncbi:YqiJ family protein [Novosphingobium profundi]|uniref:YqiJ family protein n=1 Tax=Novosphingobium profundi TaxID=1774954 RepID=UPI001BDB633B|nr:YqiJ family protein [Novosphingobium profundi]MBT0667131.1 YqiJ family protein [Novosphingobium profundi]